MFKFQLSINVWTENYLEYLKDTFCLIDLIWLFLSGTCTPENVLSVLTCCPRRLNEKKKVNIPVQISLDKYIHLFFVSTLVYIIATFKKIFAVRHSNNVYLHEPVFLAGIVNVNFGRWSWIKIWNLWGISRTGWCWSEKL